MVYYSIFLDDEREPPNNNKNWIIVRNNEDFFHRIDYLGIENIEAISLDHDLGQPYTGLDVLRKFIQTYPKNMIDGIHVYSHSMNPIGYKNINSLWANFLEKG